MNSRGNSLDAEKGYQAHGDEPKVILGDAYHENYNIATVMVLGELNLAKVTTLLRWQGQKCRSAFNVNGVGVTRDTVEKG